jgi:hypothetical protein
MINYNNREESSSNVVLSVRSLEEYMNKNQLSSKEDDESNDIN